VVEISGPIVNRSLSDIATVRSPANRARLSIVHPDLLLLERRRVQLGITKNQWAAAAGVGRNFFFDHSRKPRPATLERLARALDELAGIPRMRPPALVAAFVRAAEVIVQRLAGDAGLIGELTVTRHNRERVPQGVQRARLRRLAIYLAAVELEVSNAELSRALRMTRQNVAQARQAIEELRERPGVDRLLERCRALLKGAA